MERTQRRLNAERAALREQARELRDRIASSLSIIEPETYIPTVIPAFGTALVNLPISRRREFRRFLIGLIRKASDPSMASTSVEVDPPRPPEIQAVLDAACGLCKGFCCCNGGDRAYLSEVTLQGYMALHRDQRPRDVFKSYVSHFETETVDGSCIFHGPKGCALPREMRAGTCNRYYCPDLVNFQGDSRRQGQARGFFVSTKGNAFRSAAFCDEHGAVVEWPTVL